MPDLLITIPSKFTPEIKYTFEILINEFLGQSCDFVLQADNQDFHISGNGIKTLIIKNVFFNHYLEPTGYLSSTALPRSIVYWSDTSLFLDQLPILYGQGRLEESTTDFTLYADIIASSYFMLSRWEELVDDSKDIHQRSTATSSIAYQYHFLDRPIVNEYADLLWTLLCKAGYTEKRKTRTFECVVSHDIDQQYQWPDNLTSIKHLAGDLIKRRDLSLFSKNLKTYIQTTWFKHPDPFDHHLQLLDLADEHGVRACFNFIVSQSSSFDQGLSPDDPRMLKLIRLIENRGHEIGFHPGYGSYLDGQNFEQELAVLQNLTQQKIQGGRQHYLRFKTPYTWRLWEQAGMLWESSLGYSDRPGFRCGSCYSYTVFDCLDRKKLKLKEKPLILMDASLIYYMTDWSLDEMQKLRAHCQKHEGEWTTIWHNDLVSHPKLAEFESLIY